jgi:hypothetical protein
MKKSTDSHFKYKFAEYLNLLLYIIDVSEDEIKKLRWIWSYTQNKLLS